MLATRTAQDVDPSKSKHAVDPRVRRAALLALDGTGRRCWSGLDGYDRGRWLKQCAHFGERVGAEMMTGAQSVVPDFMEALAQQVQQEPSQKLDGPERTENLSLRNPVAPGGHTEAAQP